jgi:hypothetical protein
LTWRGIGAASNQIVVNSNRDSIHWNHTLENLSQVDVLRVFGTVKGGMDF